jgi:hypothetical protein
MSHTARATLLLVAGLALRDCVLLATGVMVWVIARQQQLTARSDRAHAWLACMIDGGAMLAVGALLAANTALVVLGWWPSWTPLATPVAAALALVVAVGGLTPAQVTRRHLAIGFGAAVAALLRQPWAACAFALLVAAATLTDGARLLGPTARALAARHDER